jgi:diguanylate cyclase (GGDEF)-like protein
MQHADASDGKARPRKPSSSLAAPLASLLSLRIPSPLVTSRRHELLLRDRRMQFIFVRLLGVSVLLAFATVAWIPVDFLLFDSRAEIVLPLALGRMVAAGAFAAIGYMHRRFGSAPSGVWGVALLIAVGIAFFAYAHAVIAIDGRAYLGSSAHAQYLMLPMVLTTGISIFPLTLIEVASLCSLPLLALTVELFWVDGGLVWSQEIAVLLMMAAIIAVATVCSLGQLRLLVDLHEQSTVDPLTGTLSRRAGMQVLDILFSISARRRTPLALLFFDLDYFKAANDRFGHDAGDALLREFARNVKARMRRQDAFIRWGGEEYLLALVDTDVAGAIKLALALGRAGFGLRPDGSPQTTSIGIAERTADAAPGWDRLVELADGRMYEAKQRGRDRLVAPGPTVERLSEAGPDHA